MKYIFKMKQIRSEKGISQKEMAEKLDTTQQLVSQYETCLVEPTIKRLIEIAQILDVSLDELVEFEKIHEDYSKELEDLKK